MDYSPPGSSVHGVLQTRILEWAAISFSRGSSQTGDQTFVSCIGRWSLQYWAQGSPSSPRHSLTPSLTGLFLHSFIQQNLLDICCLPEGLPCGSEVKSLPANAGDKGSIPGLGRVSGERNGNSVHYSCLENTMDRGAWRATVHGVAKSWLQLRNWTTTAKER